MADSTVSDPVMTAAREVCQGCGHRTLRRVGRNGFLQARIFPLFGYYPWECTACRRTHMLRKRGLRAKKQG